MARRGFGRLRGLLRELALGLGMLGLLGGMGLAACGDEAGGDDPVVLPPGVGAFPEATPPQAAVTQALDGLLAEFADAADPATMAAIDAYVAGHTPQEPPEDVVHHEPAGEADLLRMIGTKAFLMGDTATAGWCLTRAALLDPARGLSQVAFLLNQAQRYDEARVLGLKATTLAPDDPVAQGNLAFSYWRLGDLPRARFHQTLAVGLVPEDPWPKVRLGDIARDAGDVISAHLLYQIAQVRAPDDPEIAARLEATPLPEVASPLVPRMLGHVASAAQTPTLAEDIEAMVKPLDDQFTDRTSETGDLKLAALDLRQAELQANLATNFGCQAECGSNDDCKLACFNAMCAAEVASHGKLADTLTPLPARDEAAATEFLSSMHAAVAQVLARHVNDPRTDAEDIAGVLTDARVREQEVWVMIEYGYSGTQAGVDLDAMYPAGFCEAAAEFAEQLAARRAMFANPGVTADICLDGVLCVGVNNGAISLSGNIGVLAGDIAYDPRTGDFTLGLGLGIKDPTGTIDASLALKFSRKQGVGVGADIKIGGPAKVKFGRDVYLGN